MVPGRKRRPAKDRLEPYRQIRKPMPPPEKVAPDRRREIEERESRREIQESDDPEGER